MTAEADDLLSNLNKAFIVSSGEQTLFDALRTYQEQGADESWFLVVTLKDGSHRVASFAALQERVKAEGQASLTIPLRDLGEELLMQAPEVGVDTSLSDALKAAPDSPAGVAVVVWGSGAVVGVLQTSSGAQPLTSAAPGGQTSADEPTPGDEITVGDIVGSKGVAIGDAAEVNIYEMTEVAPTFETGPQWLRDILTWVQQNALIAALGFVVVVAVPTAIFYRQLIPEPATRMTGTWNIAVAPFTSVGSQRIRPKDAELMSEVFFGQLEAELEELKAEFPGDYTIQARGPAEVRAIRGTTPERRERDAARLADQLSASVIIYGTVERTGDSYFLQPEFYVAVKNYYEAAEVVGYYTVGGPIKLTGDRETLPAQVAANTELTNRSQVIALIARGLNLYFSHRYGDAFHVFKEANSDRFWQISDQGRQPVYVFQGNAAVRAELLDEAIDSYLLALDVDDQYSRAYAGLASAYYLQALAASPGDSFEPDPDLLDTALATYNQALDAENQPVSADVPTKVAIGQAQIYLAQWFIGQDTLDPAIAGFEQVIAEYEENDNIRVKEFAAESYARLGLIARQQGDMQQALNYFTTAVNLSTSASRQGLYYVTLADLHTALGNTAEADQSRASAINSYQSAISLTIDPAVRGDYRVEMALQHVALGDIDSALEQWDKARDSYHEAEASLAEQREAEDLVGLARAEAGRARLGAFEREYGDIEVAVDDYLAAVEFATQPASQAGYWLILGEIYDDLGQEDRAQDAYQQASEAYAAAIEATTDKHLQAEFWVGIATAYEMLGQTPDARAALEQALDLLPEGDDARQDIEARLDALS